MRLYVESYYFVKGDKVTDNWKEFDLAGNQVCWGNFTNEGSGGWDGSTE
jgi:hypothetical protein